MSIAPMLATLADAPLQAPGLVYEPKYDGIRAIVEVTPARGGARVSIWSRNGNDKTPQFPTVVRALEDAAVRLEHPVTLDGEIVALDNEGRPAGFQRLQGRIHVIGARDVERLDREQPVAFIAFDLLRAGNEDLCARPLTQRRTRLERLFERMVINRPDPQAGRSRRAGSRRDRRVPESSQPGASRVLRLSEQAADGRALYQRALAEHWEGLIAKEAASTYQPGRRSPAWRKIKVLQEQEFVIGGWTEPRQTRQYFGALLLGVYEHDRLTYVGHTGTGFDQNELERVWKLLRSREIAESPFSETIKTNEPPHWVRPELIAQVKFTEWTADEKLRHPVYLGLRDDKRAEDVVREAPAGAVTSKARAGGSLNRGSTARAPKPAASVRGSTSRASTRSRAAAADVPDPSRHLIEQIRALEDARRDGALELPDGSRLSVTNLAKVFWPQQKLTKGDLLRYYVQASPLILPAVADRPLVMKRFPNGVNAPAFYQQRQRLEKPPPGVRIERLSPGLDPISEADAQRFIGGSLTTLLYMTQIAAISQDPWFSRVQSPLDADYVAIDLDPGEGTPFARVLDVARWVRDELESLRVPAVAKTSGSSGLHIYIPLPPGTSYDSGLIFCQIVATIVASRHPKVATVERTVRARPVGTVYVDYLQNVLGKTLATAYSARASEFAGVSTPLAWKELDEAIDPRDYTIATAPARFKKVGDLWARLRTGKPADLEAVFRKYSRP